MPFHLSAHHEQQTLHGCNIVKPSARSCKACCGACKQPEMCMGLANAWSGKGSTVVAVFLAEHVCSRVDCRARVGRADAAIWPLEP